MTKKKIITSLVTDELWRIFQKNYPMSKYNKEPHSDAQIAFLKDASTWVYETFGDHVLKADLKKMKREMDDEYEEKPLEF